VRPDLHPPFWSVKLGRSLRGLTDLDGESEIFETALQLRAAGLSTTRRHVARDLASKVNLEVAVTLAR